MFVASGVTGVEVGGTAVFVGTGIVGVFVGTTGCVITSIAQTFALSVAAGPNCIVIAPAKGAMLLKTTSTARSIAPAAAYMS